MPDDPVSILNADPARTGLFLDFDGTLSEIVHVPFDARPLSGVPEVLSLLASRFAIVSIVSGRSGRQLLEWLGPDVEIWGVHGAERTTGGEVTLTERAAGFAELMGMVREEAAEAMGRMSLPGIFLEDKGVMLGLHFRAAEDREAAARALGELADDLAARHGLLRAGGRLAYELRPPMEFSKAAVVLERARQEDLRAAAFVGDDRVDLPGFDAMEILSREGVEGLKVAVSSDEVPPELLRRADLVLEGPREVLRFLEQLALG